MPSAPDIESTPDQYKMAVWGFKSIAKRETLELRPLTLLAGANSSGKSSMMQPLLLLKQTLEVSYDPGALLLDGPNVRFSSADQIFSRTQSAGRAHEFGVGIVIPSEGHIEISFHKLAGQTLNVKSVDFERKGRKTTLVPGMDHDQIISAVESSNFMVKFLREKGATDVETTLVRDRFLLNPMLRVRGGPFKDGPPGELFPWGAGQWDTSAFQRFLRDLIHLPGLRGNPARNYPVTAVGNTFSGTFEAYTASVIARWQTDKSDEKLHGLGEDLISLGLTWKVSAASINDTQVELLVGRLPKPARGGAKDMVSIADVGFGVSQTLPVLVALHAAKPGQTVYLEQPEIHLHPRAQVAMASVLAKAIRRGVRLIVETHSSLLLLGLQTLVAKGELLGCDDVKLHWFQRKADDGTTFVTAADLDKAGAFGDWPEDFGHVSLEADNAYLTAAEARLHEELGR